MACRLQSCAATIALYMTVALLALQQVATVPQWHTAYDGSKYLIETNRTFNWFNAWQQCATQNLQLLVIESKAKNDLIVSLLVKDFGHPLDVWIGGHDTLETNSASRQFYWMPTGRQLSFTYWWPGKQSQAEQHCLLMTFESSVYEWDDYGCSRVWGYICEQNPMHSKYQQQLQKKGDATILANLNLLQDYRQQQRQIRILNTKTDFEIRQILFYLKENIERVQNEANQKIEEAHKQRKQKIAVLFEEFAGKLNGTVESADEILNVKNLNMK